jgi:copper(I)-binding protein
MILALLAWTLSACSETPAQVEVSDATLYLHPVEGRPSAVYFTLKNIGDESDMFLSVEIEGAERGEIHTAEEKDGIAKMIHLSHLEIPGGREIVFERGSYHVMAFGMSDDVTAGDEVTITLDFEKTGIVKTTALVKALGSTSQQ